MPELTTLRSQRRGPRSRATATASRGGYFHTGDAAVVEPDVYVQIRDRYEDLIIGGGENISSVEVEGALLRQGEAATPEDLREFARGQLAHFEVPSGYTIVDASPKTATGKIRKFVLRRGRAGIAAQ